MKSKSFKRYFILLYPFLMLITLVLVALISNISLNDILMAAAKPFASPFYRLSFIKEFLIVGLLSVAMNLSLSMGEMNFSLEGIFHMAVFLSALVAIYFAKFFIIIALVPIVLYLLWQVPKKVSRGDGNKLIISSLIFNYLILGAINYLVYTFFSDENISSSVTKDFAFALDIKLGIAIAVVSLIAFIIFAVKTSLITKLKIIKDAPSILISIGTEIKKEKRAIDLCLVLLTSVAAFLYLFLNYNRFSLQSFTGYGFDAITVTLLARGDFKKLAYPAILITYIRLLSLVMQTEFSFVSSVMYLMQGVLIFISILEARDDRNS